MRYLIICLALFLVLVSFCVIGACYVSDIVTRTEQLLVCGLEEYQRNNEDETINVLELAQNLWKQHENRFGMLLYHDEIEHVTSELASLQSYVRAEDRDDFQSNCAALIKSLGHIRDMQWPFLYNIL